VYEALRDVLVLLRLGCAGVHDEPSSLMEKQAAKHTIIINSRISILRIL
jgi:hypothetical protein